MSPQAYILKKNKWEAFLPSIEHTLYKELKARYLQNEKQHFDLLENLIKQKLEILEDNKSFVSRYNLGSVDETFSIWTPGQSLTIAPKVDIIILGVFDDNEEDEVFKTACIPIKKIT